MDALSAAAQSVEAAQPLSPRSADRAPAAASLISATSAYSLHQQQPPWQVHLDSERHERITIPSVGAVLPHPHMPTTPMGLENILNADAGSESDDADVEFVGTTPGAADTDAAETGLLHGDLRERWRAHSVLAVARQHGAGGNGTAIAAGGGFSSIVRWPTSVPQSSLADSSASRGRQQPPANPQFQQQEQRSNVSKTSAAKRDRGAAQPQLQPRLQPKSPAGMTMAAAIRMKPPRTPPDAYKKGLWTDAEKVAFGELFRMHGANWKLISTELGTRSAGSVAGFAKRLRDAAQKSSATLTSTIASDNRSSSSGGAGAGSEPQSSAGTGIVIEIDSTQPSLESSDVLSPAIIPAQDGDVEMNPAADESAAPTSIATPRVLNLSGDEPSQRPRRGSSQHSEPTTAAIPAVPAQPEDQPQAAAAAVLEVIEINTEESATETPQKAPRRTVTRPTRFHEQQEQAQPPRSQFAKNKAPLGMPPQPQRKKPKLTVAAIRDSSFVADYAPVSPSSSSVTSVASKPKKRGKKRPQQEFDGIPYSPMGGARSSSSSDDRECEFCRLARGVCAIMNCTSCLRAYHAKCLVNHFKPYCSGDEPLEQQLEALHLSAPSQVKLKMLRCVPCYTVIVDNVKRDGYAWDCDCPSCAAPEKLVNYRHRMVLQLMYSKVEDIKPSKTKKQTGEGAKQDGASGAGAASAKAQAAKKPVTQPTRAGTRRTRNTAAVASSENELMDVDSEASAEVSLLAVVAPVTTAASDEKMQTAMCSSVEEETANGVAADADVDAATEVLDAEANGDGDAPPSSDEKSSADGLRSAEDGGKQEEDDRMDGSGADDAAAIAEPEQEQEAGSSHSSSPSKPPAAVTGASVAIPAANAATGEPELSDAEILAAIPAHVDGNFVCFNVVCTETPSLTASGVLREGTYFMHSKDRAKDSVYCPCCEKRMPREQFVRHTDARFMEIEGKMPWDFLFACHRDGTASPLTLFLEFLDQQRASNGLGSLRQSKASQKSLKNPLRNGVGSVHAAGAEDTAGAADDALSTALKQLKSVVIARRVPGSADTKSSASSSSSSSGSSSSKLPYLIRLVCVSSKLTIPMTDGMVQNKLDRSTPGDFPHKDGWLYFDKGSVGRGPSSGVAASPMYGNVHCDCCSREMDLEKFIKHTGLEPLDKKFKRRYVYVPQQDNQRALIELERVWQAVLTLYNHHALEAFMASLPSTGVRL